MFVVAASPKGSALTIDASTAHLGEDPPGLLHPSGTVQLLILADGSPSRDRSLGRYPICFGSSVRTRSYHSRHNGMRTYVTNRFIAKMKQRVANMSVLPRTVAALPNTKKEPDLGLLSASAIALGGQGSSKIEKDQLLRTPHTSPERSGDPLPK